MCINRAPLLPSRATWFVRLDLPSPVHQTLFALAEETQRARGRVMKPGVGHFMARAVLLGIIISAGASARDRAPSGLSVASPTLEVDFPAEGSLLQFFRVPQEGQEELNIDVFLTYRTTGQVRTSYLETLGPQGGTAEIATAFALDADGDQIPELFMVAKWPIRHSGLRTEGTYYRVFAYRRLVSIGGDLGFERARDIEEHLGSGFDGVREGERVSFPYKDYESIRAAMSR